LRGDNANQKAHAPVLDDFLVGKHRLQRTAGEGRLGARLEGGKKRPGLEDDIRASCHGFEGTNAALEWPLHWAVDFAAIADRPWIAIG
jgi:hypothetical protein